MILNILSDMQIDYTIKLYFIKLKMLFIDHHVDNYFENHHFPKKPSFPKNLVSPKINFH